jgi:hypothetical protein
LVLGYIVLAWIFSLRKVCWVFLPCEEGFSQDKSLCLLVLVYLLLIYFNICLLNVKRRSKCYGKSNVNKTNENPTTKHHEAILDEPVLDCPLGSLPSLLFGDDYQHVSMEHVSSFSIELLVDES